MWYELIKEYKPKNMLEIGVYRGQVISLWALIAKELNMRCEIHGISPFTSAGDEVSVYISNINYYEDVINNFNHFLIFGSFNFQFMQVLFSKVGNIPLFKLEMI